MQLQKEKEENILEVHHKILQGVGIKIGDVQVKYEGTISKVRANKDKEHRIKDVTFYE